MRYSVLRYIGREGGGEGGGREGGRGREGERGGGGEGGGGEGRLTCACSMLPSGCYNNSGDVMIMSWGDVIVFLPVTIHFWLWI